ncbi:MAG TPA: O-antigen polymerase [Terriglobia bacterium]|nr:O-antigen polymerase [Terriglobia bacterium]
MNEFAVSLGVAAIIGLIVWRYKTVFCLPFFWAALFACIYLGLLQIRAQSGGSSYLYAAEGFGMFFLGLLAADILFSLRSVAGRLTNRGRHVHRASPVAQPKPSKEPKPTRIKLLFPPLPLSIGLFVSLSAATIITIIFFGQQGFPILSSNPALAWVQSTSGIVNRLMSVFGPGCYAVLGLMAWAVHRETGSRTAKWMTYLGLGLSIVTDGLLGTKSAAIMVFVWFNLLLFYMNKRRELWKTILPLIIIVVPASAAIVAVRMMSTQGYWQAESIYETYFDRLTTVAAEPLDFTFKYMNRFGAIHEQGFIMEARRIREQLTGAQKTPVLSEYVYNLMQGSPPGSVDLSATLTIEGTGYVEWGMLGLLLYSFLQGLGFGLVHRYLYSRETMNIISLVVWGGILSYGIQLSSTGIFLVGLEGILLQIIPPLALLLPFGAFFLLPMARRYRSAGGGRISRLPQLHIQAGRGGER